MGKTELGGHQVRSNSIPVGDIVATGTPSSTTFLRGDGVWATPAGGSGALPTRRTHWFMWEDWLNANVSGSTIGDNLWTFISVGTGGTLTKLAPSATANQGRFGILQLNAPATLNAGACVHLNNNMNGVPGDMTVEFDFSLITDQLLQTVRIGLHNATTTAVPTAGLYFEYVGSATAGTWAGKTANSATIATTAGTAAPAAAGTFQRFKIVTNAAGTSVEFFVNEVSLGSITTNLPAATLTYGANLLGFTGTAGVKQWKSDYFQVQRAGITR